jgi:hypothetical protein
MSETPSASYSEPTLVPSSTIDTMARAARDGAADAREMAERVWSGTSLFLSRFVYTTSYTLSFGVVFPATILARSIPRNNAAVRGLIDGARAATAKVDEIKGHPGRPGVPALILP